MTINEKDLKANETKRSKGKAEKHPSENLLGWLLKVVVLVGVLLLMVYMLLTALLSSFQWGRNIRRDPVRMELNSAALLKETKFTDSYGGTMHKLEIPIKADMTGGNDLCLWVVHSYIDVYFDGELVYTTKEPSTPHIGRSPGCYWVFVPMKTNDAGKTIQIFVRPAYKQVSERLPKVYLGRRDEVVGYRFLEEMGMVVVAVLCIAFGVIFSALALASKIRTAGNRAIFYMGIFIAVIGLWKFTDTPSVVALFNSQAHLFTYVCLLCLCYFPTTIMAYLTWLNPGERMYYVLTRVYLLFALAITFMQAFNIRDLRENLHLMQMLLVTCIVFILEKNIYNLRYHDNNWHKLAFIVFGIAGFGDLVLYLYGYDSFHQGFTLTIVLFYAIINGIMVLVKTADQEDELRRRNLQLKNSQMALMMSQIRPHFIYNTLNAIYVLCGREPDRAKIAIYDFSKYLRINFQQMDKTEMVPFKEELQHAQFYVKIEQLRFSDAINVKYDIKEEDFSLPALTLQPLVENAIRHGIRSANASGSITVSTFAQEEEYCVCVEDDGEGFDVEKWEENIREKGGEDETGRRHVGLANVRERIKQYGGRMMIESEPGHGTRMIICMPMDEDALFLPEKMIPKKEKHVGKEKHAGKEKGKQKKGK